MMGEVKQIDDKDMVIEQENKQEDLIKENSIKKESVEEKESSEKQKSPLNAETVYKEDCERGVLETKAEQHIQENNKEPVSEIKEVKSDQEPISKGSEKDTVSPIKNNEETPENNTVPVTVEIANN